MASVHTTSTIRVFSYEDDPEAAAICEETVGLAFATEPNNPLFCSEPAAFAPRWAAIARLTSRRAPSTRLLHSAAPDHSAVALAYSYPEDKAPDDAPPPAEDLAVLAATSRPEAGPVRDELIAYLDERKAAFLQERGPFEYLAFLATRPGLQGRGLGSALLRHIAAKADSRGRWSYLEATCEENARLYERHGFSRLGERQWELAAAPGARCRIILMARPPGGAGALNLV